MEALVDDILGVARADAGEVRPVAERMDLGDEFYDVLDVLTPVAEQAGVALVSEVEGSLVVDSDPRLWFSVLSNVVRNAIQHAESQVSVRVSGDERGVSVAVWNDGAPLTPEDAARVFDRFFSGTEGGSGVGMALVKEYARLLGADVSMGEEKGRTVCRLRLGR